MGGWHVRNSQRTDILKTKIGKNKRKKKEETEMKILALFVVQVNAKQAWVTVFLVREMVMFQKIKKIKSKNEKNKSNVYYQCLQTPCFVHWVLTVSDSDS